MRRILVPLDGAAWSTAILPEARRAAGEGGTLVLLNAVHRVPPSDPEYPGKERAEVEASRAYLREQPAFAC